MLKKFIKFYLLINFIFCSYTYALDTNCIVYNDKLVNQDCTYIKQDNHSIYIKKKSTNNLYKRLEVYINGKKYITNDKLLTKSMKHDEITAENFKNMYFIKNKFVLILGTLKGDNYVEFKMFFNSQYGLIKVVKQTTNFFTDGTSKKVYKLKEKLLLSDLTYNKSFIHSEIFDYLEEVIILIQSKRQYLFNNPNKNSKTKMYLIKGDKVEILEEKDDWLYILYKGKKDIKAWIPKNAVQKQEIKQPVNNLENETTPKIKENTSKIEAIKEEKTFLSKLLEFFSFKLQNKNSIVMQS
ncbi:MAG: hypothetical protein GY932_04435 [Arcobacter sp.]|nr:hypothetical protein [Arcobacter sp.]